MMNQMFGWLMLCTLIGEFPNMTFSVVYSYLYPELTISWSYIACFMLVIVVLLIASSAAQEMSDIKDWLQFDGERQQTRNTTGNSMQRRIIVYELSLNQYALKAHGFFQLSVPAFVSVSKQLI